jgi:hypothetical protein
VGVAEPEEQRPRRRPAEELDELLPEQSQGHRVEHQRALASEAEDTSAGVRLQQLAQVEVLQTHPGSSGNARASLSS